MADNRFPARHPLHADRQDGGDDSRKTLGYGGNGQSNTENEYVEQRCNARDVFNEDDRDDHHERQVAAGLVRGLPNKVIADELQIARKTVDIHRKRALDKLGVDSVANLVRLSLEHDLRFDSDA